MTTTETNELIEWGYVLKAYPGETESGDQYLVQPFENGVLVAVVDGLGHGAKAAAVAKQAVTAMKDYPQETVKTIFEKTHRILRSSRGVVMSAVSFNGATDELTWLGVGNVKGMLFKSGNNSPRDTLLLRGGIVGYRLPSLYPSTISLKPGDTMVLATDGLQSDFVEGIDLRQTPQQIADNLFTEHVRGTDDALILVARYR
ncbi:SpoIIE family protein phosphatase [Anaerolineales bacterium HSG6]|nr:SpoIIE family protein phosphatase [Anaerolineales bacterium HSG6]MDM8532317.1 SpoIIE family protein phosphatase [Anaerolineales bacterium HSG25]